MSASAAARTGEAVCHGRESTFLRVRALGVCARLPLEPRHTSAELKTPTSGSTGITQERLDWIGLPETGRSAHRVPFQARRQKEGGGCVISQGIERMSVLSIDDVLLGGERRTTDDGERIATEAASGRRAKRLGSGRGEKCPLGARRQHQRGQMGRTGRGLESRLMLLSA